LANQLVEYKKFTFGDLDETMIQTIHETIAKDCTEPQFRLFMTISKSLGANPLLNEIYPTVYLGKLVPQFGIGFHVKQARKHNDYKGYDAQMVHEHDKFNMHQERAEDGRYYAVIDEHSWTFPRGKIIGGYAIAYRDGFSPFTVVMGIEEVEHLQNSQSGMQKTMWKNNLPDMFKKHVAKRALNAAFGLGFEDDEAQDSNNAPYERKEINPDAETTPSAKEPTKPASKRATEASKAIDVEITPVDEETERKALNKTIKAKLKELGIVTDADILAYMNTHMKAAGDVPTISERKALLSFIEKQIADKGDDLPE
jgi:recombination protein RecT